MVAKVNQFCAEESLGRNEGLAGTAVPVKCFVLIEHYGRWARQIQSYIEESDLEIGLRENLQQFINWCPDGVRVLFVRKAAKQKANRIILVRSDFEVIGGHQFDLDNLTRDISFRALRHAYENPGKIRDLLLVCTHGKKDKCCAKYGVPVFQYLSEYASQYADVWQCSHVGGDRFAANVLWLPAGLAFGHVHCQMEQFLTALQNQRISLRHLRGRCCVPNAAQYIEVVCRKHWGLDEICDVEVTHYSAYDSKEGGVEASVGLQFDTKGRNIEVMASLNIDRPEGAAEILMSCSSGSYGVQRQFRIRSISVTGPAEFSNPPLD